MGIQLPAASRAIGLTRASGIDASIALKLEMRAPVWVAFRQSLGLRPEDFDDAQRFLLGPDEGWWDPSGPARLPTVQRARPDARVLNVGYAERSPSQVVVYIFWHET